MLDSLYVVIEFGLGLAGFAGIVVALAGDPRNWTEGERVRVFGLILSAFIAAFGAFLCLTLAKYYPVESAVRFASGSLFLVALIFFPRQVYRTFYLVRESKENYSLRVTVTLSVISISILSLSLIAALGLTNKPLPLFYGALVLNLLFAAFIYIRLLLYRPAGSTSKVRPKRSNNNK
jgi:hypothetical protein